MPIREVKAVSRVRHELDDDTSVLELPVRASSEARGQFDCAERSVPVTGDFDQVTSNMIACTHLVTKVGGPVADIPLQAFGSDISPPEDRNDADIFIEVSWFQYNPVDAIFEHKG